MQWKCLKIATPSCIIAQCLVSSCIILDFETENTIREFDAWDEHHCRTYQHKIGLKKNGTVIRREDTCDSHFNIQFPTQIAKKGSYHEAANLALHSARSPRTHFPGTNSGAKLGNLVTPAVHKPDSHNSMQECVLWWPENTASELDMQTSVVAYSCKLNSEAQLWTSANRHPCIIRNASKGKKLSSTMHRITHVISLSLCKSHILAQKSSYHDAVSYALAQSNANETATTKRPQTSRVRDFNQTFCIQKFRDMHICSLDFKTMPWHAWFQNKIAERYKIERYNDSRSIFCPLLMHFNENITYIFFVLYIT